MSALRCPLGTCPRCDEIDRRERDAKCVSNPEPDALTRFVSRPESLSCLAFIAGAACDEWRLGGPFWPTVAGWAVASFVSLCVLAVLYRLTAWRDRWIARRRA